MHEIRLDGSRWHTRDDFYDALLHALGAPAWHGHNLDALSDTIRGGDVNAVNPPFVIRIAGCATMAPDVRAYVERFLQLIADLHAQGMVVEAQCLEGEITLRAP